MHKETTSRSLPVEFQIAVAQDTLDDLSRRLRATRWAPEIDNDDGTYGFRGTYLRELVGYWTTEFDWRAQEEQINSFANYRTTVQGMPVHFIHERGRGPDPFPLILSHGWPWTFWDYRKLIGPLTDPAAFGGDASDSFDVVIPSLPGFGFSNPLERPGINFWGIADAWAELMRDQLGYTRFGAQGGDIGSMVTAQLGHKYADCVAGIHMAMPLTLDVFNLDRPWADLLGVYAEDADAAERQKRLEWERARSSHLAVHVIEPQTLSHAMHDSPAGMAAWILQRRIEWGDCRGGDLESVYTKDELLTTATIFWATETFHSSLRPYIEANRRRWVPTHSRTPVVEAPTGMSVFLPDMPPTFPTEWLKDYYNLQLLRIHERGGHFNPAEAPTTLLLDIVDTFRELR